VRPFHLLAFPTGVIAILAFAPAAIWGNTSASTKAAERKLLSAIQAGKTADFSTLPDEQRTIGAEFLKRLLFDASEAPSPKASVHIKGAILKYFSIEDDQRKNKKIPFELFLDSCVIENFLCPDCYFQKGLRISGSYFRTGGALKLDGAQIQGPLEVESANNVVVSLVKTRVTGPVRVSLTASSALVADSLRAESVEVNASAPTELRLTNAMTEFMNFHVQGDGISGIDVQGSIVGALSIEANGPLVVNSSRLTAKNAFFFDRAADSTACNASCLENTQLILDRSNIERTLSVTARTHFLLTSGLTVKETATFNVDASFADLSFSTFDALDWVYHPDSHTTLNGVSFRTLNVSPSSDPGFHPSVPVSLNFLRQSQFPISAFAAYQSQLKTQGDNASTERAYIEMHKTLRDQEWQHWFTWPLGIVDLFQQYVLGFGHSPVPPLSWSLTFVVFGAFAFRKATHMQPRVDKPSDYSGAWYSLELFLPIVDLGVAKEWRPKSDSKWRVAYARVHQMAGWVLVPVALAAITGVVK